MPFFTGDLFEICDLEAQGTIWATATEAEAVEFVSGCYRKFGAAYVATMFIVRWDDEHHGSLIAEGLQLVKRLRATDTSRTVASETG